MGLCVVTSGFTITNLYHMIHNMQLSANEVNNWTWILIRVQRNDLQLKCSMRFNGKTCYVAIAINLNCNDEPEA